MNACKNKAGDKKQLTRYYQVVTFVCATMERVHCTVADFGKTIEGKLLSNVKVNVM